MRSVPAHADDFPDEPFYSKLRARSGVPARDDLMVFADCNCGWAGPVRWCDGQLISPETTAAVTADREGHEAATGHGQDPEVGAEGRHDFGCGFYHGLTGRCPLPVDSPAGRVQRVLRSRLGNRHAALDALVAIDELRAWLAEQEPQAVIGARIARATWAEMGEAVGITRQGAFNRWGAVVKGYEAAGVLEALPEPPEPATPVDPCAGDLRDARDWCRWCGHRVIASGIGAEGRWIHHQAEGFATREGIIEVPDCPGPEPWPANLPPSLSDSVETPDQRATLVADVDREDPTP